MALDFPSSPTNGQSFQDYTYDSSIGTWRSTPVLPGGLPAGSILAWPTNTAPSNWLICDGSAVSRSTYSSLFYVIGTTYGVGDGSTTFNLPDLRGRIPVGKNAGTFGTLAASGGAETHVHGSSSMTATAYAGYWATRSGTSWTATNSGGLTAPGSDSTTSGNGIGIVGNTNSASSLPPYLTINYIIKSSGANTPGDSALVPRIATTEANILSLQLANQTTNQAALVPVIPTSAIVTSGTTSTSSTGKTLFTGTTGGIKLNGVFSSAYTHYKIRMIINTGNNDYVYFKFVQGGVATTTAALYGSAGYAQNATFALAFSNQGVAGAQFGYASSAGGNVFDLDVYNPINGNIPVVNAITGYGSAGGHTTVWSGYSWNGNGTFDGIMFYTGSSTNIAGEVTVYGFK